MATRKVAHWITNIQKEDVPDSVWQAAGRSLHNYLGCVKAGGSHPSVAKVHKALAPFYGQPTCTVLGAANIKCDAQHAALLNGISSHVHDYDDTHLGTIIHPTGPVASALLAWAQHWRSTDSNTATLLTGKNVLLAMIVGIEVECKLGLAVWPKHYDVGWHISSTTGAIGAAVGVCKLMQLTGGNVDETVVSHAIGIAATQVTGLREMFGSDTKSFHIGRAAQNGLLAAMLATQGFTSSDRALEAHRGWCNVVCEVGTFKLTDYISQLGHSGQWEIEKNTFKPFPCGIVKHPAIDAAIQVHVQLSQNAGPGGILGAIKKLSFMALVHPLVLELTGKREPKNGLQAKFSVFHGIAVGLLYGKAGLVQYTDDAVINQDVVAVAKLINAIGRPDLERDEAFLHAMDPENPPKDGKFPYSVHVKHAIGSIDCPMSQQDLNQKFVEQVVFHGGEELKAKDMSDTCNDLKDSPDVFSVLGQLSE